MLSGIMDNSILLWKKKQKDRVFVPLAEQQAWDAPSRDCSVSITVAGLHVMFLTESTALLQLPQISWWDTDVPEIIDS